MCDIKCHVFREQFVTYE